MAEEYRRRYGASGAVLYPSRSREAPVFNKPPPHISDTDRPPVFAFGGTLPDTRARAYSRVQALCQLADVLARYGSKLNIYTQISREVARRVGLVHPSIHLAGLVPNAEFVSRLRAEADCLFAPMSFEAEDRANMSLCFPSKLTDYTATGLPILIQGPDYGSGVRWALENPGVAEVVLENDMERLAPAVERLMSAPHRVKLAQAALRVGSSHFAHDAATITFQSALMSAG